MSKVKWGILSTAKIGREKVIPALQASEWCDVIAIASRNENNAIETAKALNIPNAFGSYEALLADDEVEAIYIPLPNHMHVEWAIKALEANKHVLCEKPIAMSLAESKLLLRAAEERPHLKIMEAFMYRFHPQWLQAKKLVQDGAIGKVKTVQSFFSYHNIDTNNIRNIKEAGGGGLMDIGCYCISISRFLLDREPESVCGLIEFDTKTDVDSMASAMLKFGEATATFTCSTQMMPYQRVNILGETGHIEVMIPVNAPPDKQTKIWLHTKASSKEIVLEPVDQYTLQGNAFSKAVLNNTEVPTPLTDAVANMRIIEAIFESSRLNAWKTI